MIRSWRYSRALLDGGVIADEDSVLYFWRIKSVHIMLSKKERIFISSPFYASSRDTDHYDLSVTKIRVTLICNQKLLQHDLRDDSGPQEGVRKGEHSNDCNFKASFLTRLTSI